MLTGWCHIAPSPTNYHMAFGLPEKKKTLVDIQSSTNFLCNRIDFFSERKLSPVLLTWLHPDKAMSVGLAKACALRKNLFCYREN